MPIYEFYCDACHTLFNFFSKNINTNKIPYCPKCKKNKLARQMSSFAFTGKAREADNGEDLPIDENKMEQAMQLMAKEADNINEDNPKQAADLMRKLTNMTGMKLGSGMEEALSRLEKGENPEKIESEMGDLLEGEDPFILSMTKKAQLKSAVRPLAKDETLYDL